jgi:hypothetical protein
MITSCEDCVFAEYDGNEQVDCKLDRLEKFQQNGATLKFDTDTDRHHYKIHDRVCIACRNNKWGTEHPKRKWIELVTKEMEIQCDFLIYIDHGSDLQEIESTMHSVQQQNIKPKSITMILGHEVDSISIPEIIDILIRDAEGIPWYVEEIKSEKALPIDQALTSCKAPYYAVFHSGYDIPKDFLVKLNDALNSDLLQVIAVKPDENDNGMIVSRIIHDRLLGNKESFILNKIETLAPDMLMENDSL